MITSCTYVSIEDRVMGLVEGNKGSERRQSIIQAISALQQPYRYSEHIRFSLKNIKPANLLGIEVAFAFDYAIGAATFISPTDCKQILDTVALLRFDDSEISSPFEFYDFPQDTSVHRVKDGKKTPTHEARLQIALMKMDLLCTIFADIVRDHPGARELFDGFYLIVNNDYDVALLVNSTKNRVSLIEALRLMIATDIDPRFDYKEEAVNIEVGFKTSLQEYILDISTEMSKPPADLAIHVTRDVSHPRYQYAKHREIGTRVVVYKLHELSDDQAPVTIPSWVFNFLRTRSLAGNAVTYPELIRDQWLLCSNPTDDTPTVAVVLPGDFEDEWQLEI